MASFEDQYFGNHRRQQSLVLIASLLCLLLALAPRQERALFITQGSGIKAFGAAFPPIIPARLLFPPDYFGGDGTPAAFFARIPPLVPAVLTPAPLTPAAVPPPTPGAPGVPQPTAPFGNNNSFLPTPPVPPGGDLPFNPVGLFPPGTTPVGPPNGGPTPNPNPGPNPNPSPNPNPVPPVPEPATWLMMIVGFFGIGTVLRSRNGAAVVAARR